MFISDIIFKIFTKHFLTIIYSKKSHVFALGPSFHKNALVFNTVKIKQTKVNLNKPTTKENNAALIYTLQKSAGILTRQITKEINSLFKAANHIKPRCFKKQWMILILLDLDISAIGFFFSSDWCWPLKKKKMQQKGTMKQDERILKFIKISEVLTSLKWKTISS